MSLTLREEHTLRAFENKVLRRIFELMDWLGDRENCMMRSCMICNLHQVYLELPSQGGWGGWGMWHEWGRRGTCIGYW
jgi:predicted glycosyl hydrolase (DUF1957 family)